MTESVQPSPSARPQTAALTVLTLALTLALALASPPTPAASAQDGAVPEGWIGTYVYEEPGFRHGGEADDEIYSGWTWTLVVEREASGLGGTLTIDGLQTAEEYRVRIEGTADEVRVVCVEVVSPPLGGELAPGDVLLRLRRQDGRLLTRHGVREPSLEETGGEEWAVRFEREKSPP